MKLINLVATALTTYFISFAPMAYAKCAIARGNELQCGNLSSPGAPKCLGWFTGIPFVCNNIDPPQICTCGVDGKPICQSITDRGNDCYWPENKGCVEGTKQETTLDKDKVICRFGYKGGCMWSDPSTDWEKCSLSNCTPSEYHCFKVRPGGCKMLT